MAALIVNPTENVASQLDPFSFRYTHSAEIIRHISPVHCNLQAGSLSAVWVRATKAASGIFLRPTPLMSAASFSLMRSNRQLITN